MVREEQVAAVTKCLGPHQFYGHGPPPPAPSHPRHDPIVPHPLVRPGAVDERVDGAVEGVALVLAFAVEQGPDVRKSGQRGGERVVLFFR